MENTKTPPIEKGWEIKARTYQLTRNRAPLTWHVQTKHTKRKPLLWFDEETGHNHELRYATNQNSLFKKDQDGFATLGHIIFEDGYITVQKDKQALQKLLSIYHPKAGKDWVELNPEKKAMDDVESMEHELDALNLVTELEENELIAILRTEYGREVTTYTPSQVKRLGFVFARKNPSLFIDLANDDDVQLRSFANSAAEAGIITLTDNNTTFKWASNGKKIMTVPFDENPYVAFAQFLKTDEGVSVFKSIEKKLK